MTMRPFLLTTALLAVACGSEEDRAPAHHDAAAGHAPVDASPTGDEASTPDDAPSDAVVFPPLTVEGTAIAGQLQGAFLEVDCASEEIELQFCHPKDMGVENLMLKFGGEFGKSYEVTLGVWGVVEGILFQGGTVLGEHCYTGGTSNTPSIGTSGLPAEYGLVVGSQTYVLNYFEFGAGEHYTYGMEYVTDPITIPGGSDLTLFVRSPDDMMNTNHMESGVMHPPASLARRLAAIESQPLQGQFIYIEAKRITEAK
jgi:hypothetical protein